MSHVFLWQPSKCVHLIVNCVILFSENDDDELPESAGLSVGVLIQGQLINQFVYYAADVVRVDASKSGVHPQRLTHRHLTNQSVELRAVADQSLTGTCRTPANSC